MTTGEKLIAEQLHEKVTFLPASYDKRFARDMHYAVTDSPDKELTVNQRNYLYKLLHKYRRQLPETYQQYQSFKEDNKNQGKLF